jgi:hypothetical protein
MNEFQLTIFVETPQMKTFSFKSLSLSFILLSVLAAPACLADTYSEDPNSVNSAPVIGANNTSDFDVSGLQIAQNTTSANQTYATNQAPAQVAYVNSSNTGTQGGGGGFNTTTYTSLDKVYGRGQALPPTVMDSFVYNAAGSADLIYGDEGTTSIPPFFEFTEEHRINAGITSGGLTTGHASALPEAWGWPE